MPHKLFLGKKTKSFANWRQGLSVMSDETLKLNLGLA